MSPSGSSSTALRVAGKALMHSVRKWPRFAGRIHRLNGRSRFTDSDRVIWSPVPSDNPFRTEEKSSSQLGESSRIQRGKGARTSDVAIDSFYEQTSHDREFRTDNVAMFPVT